MRWLKWSAVGILGLIAVLAVAIVAVLLLVDPNDHKTKLEQQAAAMGLKVALAGDIRWRMYPFLGFTIEDVRVYAHDDATAVVELGQLSLALAWLALAQGELRVHGVELQGVAIHLHRKASGQANWEQLFAPSSSHKSDKPALEKKHNEDAKEKALPPFLADLRLGFVRFSDIKLAFADRMQDIEAEFAVQALELGRFAFDQWSPLHLQASLANQKPPLDFALDFDSKLYIASDLSVLKLSQGALDLLGTTALLGSGEQRIGVTLAQAELMPQSNGLLLQQMELEADLQQQQPSGQPMRFAGKVSLEKGALRDKALQAEGMVLAAQLTAPDILFAPAAVSATVASLATEPKSAAVAVPSLRLNLADVAEWELHDIVFTEDNKLSAGLRVQNFNPRDVLALIKSQDDEPLQHALLASMAEDSLTTAAMTAQLSATLTPLAWQISALELTVDQSTLRGNVDMRGGHDVHARLAVDTVAMERYLPLPQQPEDQNEAAAPLTLAQIYPQQPLLPLQAWAPWLLDGEIRVAELGWRGTSFTELVLTVRKRAESLQADTTASAFDGVAEVNFKMDALSATPNAALQLALQEIDMAQVQRLFFSEEWLAGKGNVSADLHFRGNSLHSWVHSLEGTAGSNLAQGRLLGLNLSKMYCQAVSALQGQPLKLEQETDYTTLKNLAARLLFAQGKGAIKALKLSLPNLGVESDSGVVDLPQLTFQLPLSLTATGNNLAASCLLPRPVHVDFLCRGTLLGGEPSKFCRPDLAPLKKRLQGLVEGEKAALKAQLEQKRRVLQQQLETEKKAVQKKLQKKLQEKRRQQEKALKEKWKNKLKEFF